MSPLRAVDQHHGPTERRASCRIKALSRQLDEVCTNAVDPLEIAAHLEAEGFTDAVARREYASVNVFTLAKKLFDAVPLRSERSDRRGGASEHPRRQMIRGGIHAAPALACVGISLTTPISPSLSRGLLLVAASSWGLSQAIAYLGYMLVGRLQLDSARLMFRRALLGGTFVLAIAAGVMGSHSGDPALAIGVFSMGVYMLASAPLIIFEEDGRILKVLACGIPLAVASGLLPGAVAPVTTAAVVVGTAMGVALQAVQVMGVSSPGAIRMTITAAEWRVALAFAAIGWCWAALLTVGLGAAGADGPLATAPLLACIGIAEWQLVSFREGARRSLEVAGELEAFRRMAWRVFLGAVGRYTAPLALLSAGVAAGAWRWYGGSSALPLLSYLLLGVAMFAALVLISLFEHLAVLACLIAGLVAFALLTRLPGGPLLDPLGGALAARALVGIALFATARHVVVRATAHA